MFMKQYNYKPRSNSTSSQGSQSGSPPKEESKPATQKPASVSEAAGAVSAGIAGRRRSSAAGAEKFAGLNAYKRNSQDEKRAGYHEQKVGGGGILGGMWHDFTKK
ncbi:uncharacterized protein AB675_3250 [Cyphellophora attinorum]|uniref:Uncharacterized protein n=1 Tax=Cyphellophora attinorum TaxID=1664694 RepID=A0A0N0NM18_9EURO|nr:uncharacterized protein AB675_3250 [Phialophora attinorum]KPI39689.1 hypothetical protein AB675_3250 [Phialophora attinorum]